MDQKEAVLHITALQADRERTLQKLANVRQILSSAVDADADDATSDLEEHDNAVAIIRGLERRLEAIDHALQRVQQGTYGICERCREPIDPARLEIVPEATLCMPCQTTIEQTGRSKKRPGVG
jgi:DnaK suppressor protein